MTTITWLFLIVVLAFSAVLLWSLNYYVLYFLVKSIYKEAEKWTRAKRITVISIVASVLVIGEIASFLRQLRAVIEAASK